MSRLTLKRRLAVFAVVVLFAILNAAIVYADGYATADTVKVPKTGVSLDPTSLNAIIAKVNRGVIAISPHEGSFVLGIPIGGSIGSGFIIDKDGWFLTNVHVLSGAAWAEITLWDNTTYRGDLIAVDPGIDAAIGQIVGCPPEKIHPVALGDSDNVVAGELALAMGQPGDFNQVNVDRSDPWGQWGLKQSATVAVIAGKVYTLEFPLLLNSSYKTSPFGSQYGTNFTYAIRMQTPIAGGNSGGPLFNIKGEVVGINFFGGSWYLAQGHNYAVPISLAKEFYYSVKKQWQDGKPLIRHAARPWLGIDICMPRNIDNPSKYTEFIERFRPKDKLLVYGVRKDSPAWYAGFMTNDEILQVNGRHFETPEELRYYIMNLSIDEEVSFTVKRGEAVSIIKVKTDVKRNYDADFSA
jgi:S1-C subfamily serine protease